MSPIYLLVVSGLSLFNYVSSMDVRLPPSISVGPALYNVYRPDDTITLECQATGTPAPVYSWTLNGYPLNENVDRISRVKVGEGTIKIQQVSALDEGRYQCHAENQHGTAVSAISRQLRAIMPTEGEKTVRTVTAHEGQAFSIERTKTRCFPKPSFEWLVAMETDTSPVKIVTSRRVQVDSDTGDLHFAYALTEDQLSQDKLYKCNVINPNLDLTAGGSYSRVTVQPEPGGAKPFAPQIGFHSPSPYVALEKHNISLRCFFYGNPAPAISWKKLNGQLSSGRMQQLNFNSELFIKNVEQSDQGTYICTGTNSQNTQEYRIHLDVQAEPVFRQTVDLPRNLNLTNADSVSVHCGAYAEPEPTITWLRNGKPLDPDDLPVKFRLSSDHRNLTISNVCKDCGGDLSDLQVIQCNASNIHGEAFAAGYINVLLRTQLVEASTVERWVSYDEEKRFLFECEAIADDSTPVTRRWFHIPGSGNTDTEEDGSDTGEGLTEVEVRNNPNLDVTNATSVQSVKRWIAANGSLILHLGANDTEGWSVYGGIYRCMVNNGYSSADRRFVIHVGGIIPTPAPRTAGIAELWWIFVVMTIIFLLLILLLFCLVYLQRNRGDTYPVDEKERQNGNNPEKELLDSEFQNYNRPTEESMKGSRSGSLGSLAKPDDVGSVDEYGDVDIGRYAEDGSFVGAYSTPTVDRKNRGRSGSRTDM